MAWKPSGSAVATLTAIPDFPSSYSGQADLALRVNAAETGIEFYDPSGAGDVVGPAGATDYAFPLYSGATGKLLRNSVILSNATADVSGMNTLTLKNTGLHLLDTDASHDLIIKPGSNLTGDRTLTVTTGDANRTLTISADIFFAGAVSVGGALTTSAQDLTLTLTGSTNVTLPTTGTVAVLANTIDQFGDAAADVSMNSHKITSVADGVSANDAANMGQLNAAISGLLVHSNCRLASTVDVPGTYVGTPTFTLTEVGFGTLSIDGVTPSVNDRILLKNQTDGKQNGIWVVTVVGSAGASYVLTRASDFDSDAEILTGAYTFITSGSSNASYGFYLTTPATITLDTTSLSFTAFIGTASYVAGSGLALSGLTFSIGAGTGIIVNADTIEVDLTVVQPKDATLTALAAYSTVGLVCMTASDTFAGRTITAGSGIAVTNGAGTAGNPTIGVDFSGLSALSAPDGLADYALVYDSSALANKKVLLSLISDSGAGAFLRARQVGTSPLTVYYTQAVTSAPLTTSTAMSTNFIRAYPFYHGRAGTIDKLGFYVSTLAASGVGRIGLYKATSETNLYPNELVIDSGELSTASTGVKEATISVDLEADQLYWMVFLFGVANPTLRALQSYATPAILGDQNTFGTPVTIGLYASLAYQALPATFPAGAVELNSNNSILAGFYHYSA